MRRNSFILELLNSAPVRILIVLALLIVIGVMIANHHQKVVKMKEDILYIHPNN